MTTFFAIAPPPIVGILFEVLRLIYHESRRHSTNMNRECSPIKIDTNYKRVCKLFNSKIQLFYDKYLDIFFHKMVDLF